MKYEFHVGDYVETKANSFGYISSINGDDMWWYCVYDKDGFRDGSEYGVSGIENDELARYYNRIGQYDFTKPKQPKKIEHIKMTDGDIRKNAPIGDSLLMLKNKINELVDAVNELRKERNNG